MSTSDLAYDEMQGGARDKMMVPRRFMQAGSRSANTEEEPVMR